MSSEEKKTLKDEAPSDVLRGTIGALLGALLGLGIWIILYYGGYAVTLGGWFIAFCAFTAYNKMGHSLDKRGTLICAAISVVMIFIANHLSVTLEIYNAVKDLYDVSFSEAFKQAPEIVSNGGLWGQYFINVIIGCIFGFIGFVVAVARKVMKSK